MTERMMSEKAKGKQRAIEVEDDSEEPLLGSSSSSSPSSSPTSSTNQKATVRFTDSSIPDLNITSLQPTDTVHDLKRLIRDTRPQLKDKRLRLIVNGRLLSDKEVVYPLFSSGTGAPNWVHCSVGLAMGPGEEREDESQHGQIRPVRGFDRLASIGFSEDEIADFRRQFHTHSTADYVESAEFGTDEEYNEHARALEEQWIDSVIESHTPLPSTLTPGSSSSNSEANTLRGILVGFFFPFLPLFFLKEPSPAPIFWENGAELADYQPVLFSQGVSMALVVGFMMNILFGLWRFLLDGA